MLDFRWVITTDRYNPYQTNFLTLSQVAMYSTVGVKLDMEGGVSGIRFGALGLIVGGFRSLQCATSHISHLGILPAQTSSHEPVAALL
jgi:hypothetical protein